MTTIGTLVWGGRKTGAGIAGGTHDRAERQVMDRIVETGGRLVTDSRIGCSRLIAAPAGMPFGDRWAAARYAPVLDFRIDRLSSGRHRESGFDNGKGGEGRKLGSKPRHVGSYDFACFSLGLEKKRCQTGIGSSEPMMLPDQTDDRTDGGVERPSIAGELSTVRESCRSREEDERCRLGRAVCWRLGTGGVDSPRSRW